ncbi:MAG: hypothetical protein KF683_17125 [Rubrivivax sp.]|nr:hypothetical protein [Rubrivivax sp.]
MSRIRMILAAAGAALLLLVAPARAASGPYDVDNCCMNFWLEISPAGDQFGQEHEIEFDIVVGAMAATFDRDGRLVLPPASWAAFLDADQRERLDALLAISTLWQHVLWATDDVLDDAVRITFAGNLFVRDDPQVAGLVRALVGGHSWIDVAFGYRGADGSFQVVSSGSWGRPDGAGFSGDRGVLQALQRIGAQVGADDGFVLTVVPEPRAWLLWLPGLALLAAAAGRGRRAQRHAPG